VKQRLRRRETGAFLLYF